MVIAEENWRQLKRLRKACSQPCLPYTAFDLRDVMQEVRESTFPEIGLQVDCFCVNYGHLVRICPDEEARTATVYVHQILNHPDTPIEVAAMICNYELLHLEIPSREVDAKMTDHPPEFREKEKAICPERQIVWSWIWWDFGHYLHRMPRRECIKVLPQWRKEWSMPRCTLPESSGGISHDGSF